MMRLLVLAASALVLAGCNVAVSTTPLFTAADEGGAPRLMPGVWSLEQEDCKFDETKPVPEWPDCAAGAVVKPGEVVGYDRKKEGPVWEHNPMVFAAGNPRIIQIRMVGEKVGEGPDKAEPYGYAAARPTKRDRQGRITAIHYWIILCGPPPPKTTHGKNPVLGTLHPLPGMKMKPGEAMCMAASAKAVRGAAKPSEGWADKTMDAHWVREGDQ
jgi:hypothetical protein